MVGKAAASIPVALAILRNEETVLFMGMRG